MSIFGAAGPVHAMREGQDCPRCEGLTRRVDSLQKTVDRALEDLAEVGHTYWSAWREFSELRPVLEWAKQFFPEFSMRLGTVEQALIGAETPHKPWLPPKYTVQDGALAAHKFRDTMSAEQRKRVDLEEGQWPYCAWHFFHARMRNRGEPLSTSLDPRDKLSVDAVLRIAEHEAFGDDDRGGDLFVYWVQRFFAHDVESWEGTTLADKFFRAAKSYPKRLPDSLCDWPATEHEAFQKPHEALWPREEIGFQWAMMRDHFHEQRSKKMAEMEEEQKRKAALAQEARDQRERELREEYAREQAEFESQLAQESQAALMAPNEEAVFATSLSATEVRG